MDFQPTYVLPIIVYTTTDRLVDLSRDTYVTRENITDIPTFREHVRIHVPPNYSLRKHPPYPNFVTKIDAPDKVLQPDEPAGEKYINITGRIPANAEGVKIIKVWTVEVIEDPKTYEETIIIEPINK